MKPILSLPEEIVIHLQIYKCITNDIPEARDILLEDVLQS